MIGALPKGDHWFSRLELFPRGVLVFEQTDSGIGELHTGKGRLSALQSETRIPSFLPSDEETM